ncbi:MAG TPA: DUF3341 domain-containing protein [Bdellovibrionales bacterium]|nr:DUF3341 domain-containing protein [Bdellovibrionales bacterium]
MSVIDKVIGAISAKGKPGIAGIWLDEHKLVEAARRTRASGYTKFEAISPFPLHGIDDAMGIPFSFIPWVTFIFGLAGFAFGTWFTWWASAVDWALVIGGKPFWSVPAFIPVIFELTILFGALSSVGALIFICGLPKVDPPVIDPALTSHKFALFVPENDTGFNAAQVEQLFRELGAVEVKRTEF